MPAFAGALATTVTLAASAATAAQDDGARRLDEIDECLAATTDDERAAIRAWNSHVSAQDATEDAAADAIRAFRSVVLARCATRLATLVDRAPFWTLEYVYSRVAVPAETGRAPSQVRGFTALLLMMTPEELRRYSGDAGFLDLRNVAGRLYFHAPPVALPGPPGKPHQGCPYPVASRALGESGTTDVDLIVAENGDVVRAEIRSSSGFPALDDAAVLCLVASGPFQRRIGGPSRVRLKWTWRLQT